MEIYYYYNSPIGILEIFFKDDVVFSIKLVECEKNNTVENKFTNKIKVQLDEYFAGQRKNFDIKFSFEGTTFQKKVWNELAKIPYGETKSYGEIAELIGHKNAQRAVGSACNKNPILLLVPCHRVIAKDGKLSGFAIGVPIKKRLLNMESIYSKI